MQPIRISLIIFLFSGTLAWSQVHPTIEAAPSRGDVYAGPVFTGNLPSNGTVGAGGGVCIRVVPWLGIEGELNVVPGTGGVANTVVISDYLFGPRISKPLTRTSRLTPFGDFLFGGQTLSNSSSQHSYYYGNGSGAAIAGDGGVDFELSHHVALRGQAGYVYSRFYASGSSPISNNRGRAAVYVVYRY